jgi:hypothetical protein
MGDRDFTEVDLRSMLQRAHGFKDDVVEGPVRDRGGPQARCLGRCERLGVPRPPRGHWQQLAVGKALERPALPDPEPGQELESVRDGSEPRHHDRLHSCRCRQLAPDLLDDVVEEAVHRRLGDPMPERGIGHLAHGAERGPVGALELELRLRRSEREER